MQECELCGRGTDEVYIVSIEGAQLRVCPSCAKGKGGVLERPARQHSMATVRRAVSEEENEQVREGFGTAIRSRREQMKLPLKVLAEMLNEKESLLLRIEQEKTQPTTALRKKLEHALGITLLSKEEPNPAARAPRQGSKEPTLGEFA